MATELSHQDCLRELGSAHCRERCSPISRVHSSGKGLQAIRVHQRLTSQESLQGSGLRTAQEGFLRARATGRRQFPVTGRIQAWFDLHVMEREVCSPMVF